MSCSSAFLLSGSLEESWPFAAPAPAIEISCPVLYERSVYPAFFGRESISGSIAKLVLEDELTVAPEIESTLLPLSKRIVS